MDKTYVIYGEDPNCDLGGQHHTPTLGYAEGKYEDVLAYAKSLPGWTTWGHGGKIKEIKVKKINSEALRREKELKNRRAQLENEIEKINKELGDE